MSVATTTMQHQRQQLLVNLGSTVPPQRVTVNSREYLTAPAVLIVVGVMNGALVVEEALVPDQWNSTPIVINHPLDAQGEPLSARSPEVFAQYGVGHVYRARLGTGRRQGHAVASLQAELWLDVALIETLGGEALQALTMIETQTPLELSTGFYAQAEATSGTFHGTPYAEVFHALWPDHLALLPNGIGACSQRDGCGCPRLNHQQACACQHKESPMDEPSSTGWRGFLAMLRQFVQREGAAPLITEQTDADIREALYSALAREQGADYTSIFIDALNLEERTFTYRQGERLRQRGWEIVDGLLTLTDAVIDVQRSTDYLPVPETTETPPQTEEPPPMPPAMNAVQVRVNSLISDPLTKWSESERHLLEALPEATLILLEAQPKLTPPSPPAPERTMEDLLATASPEEQESWREARETIARRKAAAIATLVANKAPFTEDDLRTKTAEHLESLVAFGASSQASASADYRGRGVPVPRLTAEELAPPMPPQTLDLVVSRQRELGLRR